MAMNTTPKKAKTLTNIFNTIVFGILTVPIYLALSHHHIRKGKIGKYRGRRNGSSDRIIYTNMPI